MARLLGDRRLRQQMGAASRRRIEREFSVDAMVTGNLAIYEKVLEARRR